jgi:hypothetical protein
MARLKKYGTTYNQPLSAYATFILDTEANSKYFKVTEFKDVFTGGKNGFLIEGSPNLMETTEIKIQVLDVDGNPVYHEIGNGTPEYYEGTSKVISVYVYEDTPIGEATITILGELKTYLDSGGVVLDIPDDWKGNYNVKWQKTFSLNRLAVNTDKVRFYRRPNVAITEIVKPLFSTTFANVTKKGFVQGTPIVPTEATSISDFKLPTSYKLTTIDNTTWTGSMVGSNIELTDLGFTAVISDVINKNELLVTQPYTQNGLVASFASQRYTSSFNYLEGVSNIATALTGSFAKIQLTDLTTFVGDVNRVKIFRKSQSQVGDYEFVQEVRLETNELLVDLESQTSNQDYYGLFTSDVITNYWVTSSNSLTATFNQNYLYDSVRLNTNTPQYFFTTKSIDISAGKEYALNFNVRLSPNQPSVNYLRAFLSGSKTSTYNGVVSTVGVEQTITTIAASDAILQKTTSTDNLVADEIDNARLYFEVVGTGWHIANISFTSAQETSFSPDEISFIQTVPRSLPVETFDYRFEFYDINNNYIPVLVEQTKTFNGGNLQNLQKGLVFNPRNLIFQFDSGSQPIPPTVVGFTVTKNLLTGSVTYTSQSFDFDGNELFGSDYTASFTGRRYPGLLSDITSDAPTMTVGNFTGSRIDKLVQIVKITGETEGYTDTVIFTRVLDGFGGVNHLIRPYRGTQIRNSSTGSLEVQAVRIDGVNDIELSSTTQPGKGWPSIQLHILKTGSLNYSTPEKFINLYEASASGYIKGLTSGSLGSGEINYNAVFNRDSIDKRRTVYLISSASAASGPAYAVSASVLSSIILEDLQDGLDTGVITYNTDIYNINFRNGNVFTPSFTFATASFTLRGSNAENVTASFQVYPSMSINKDFIPEYWMYYTTQSCYTASIAITAVDENKNVINAGPVNALGLSNKQSKKLTITFTYTEPYTFAQSTIDKTFTIVPDGKPGDESIVFEVNPLNVSLKANAKGEVASYAQSITDIRLKQGSRYLLFTGSISQSGTFYIAQQSILSSSITGGLVYFDKNYTSSMIVSASSGLCALSGSLTFPLVIHPYYTSSIYTQSVVQLYTKILDGPPQLEVIISPLTPTLNADEVGYVTPSGYSAANTTIKVREGQDYLTFTSQSNLPGTFRIQEAGDVKYITAQNIQLRTISSSSRDTGTLAFNRFDYPYVSASVLYNVVINPYSLGPGHQYTSSVVEKTQTFTKNVSVPNARNVSLSATSQTVNFDGDGVVTSPLDPIILTATATNTTGAIWYQFYKDDTDYTGIQADEFVEIGGGDATAPGETATWKVKIRDGNSSVSAPIRAESELTIAGIKAGGQAYNVILTNENSSVIYKVSGQITFSGTGTTIKATKGDEPLLHKNSFSAKTLDQFGNEIGSLGEYQVTILSKSGHITLAGGLVSGSIVPTVIDEALIGNITAWTVPETNSTATIVYQIDIENGRQKVFKTQSLAIQYEGATGPGIVMRGQWNEYTNYSGSVETIGYRRDAVIYPDPTGSSGVTHYFAAISGSGPTTYNKVGTLVQKRVPPAIGTDSAYWQYLGQQDFFVAAKIAIFEESFVKNTINVGNNVGSAFANIVLAGGRNDPYMAIGQYSTIGYGNAGIWQGIYDLGAGSYMPRLSLVNTDNNRWLKWTGTNLEIKGDIVVTGGDAATQTGVSGSAAAAQSAAISSANGYTGTAITAFSSSLGAMAAIDQINSGSAVTYIGAGSIVTNMVATNLVMSTNYSASAEAAPYSDIGTFIDLSNGSIKAPNFAIQSNGDAKFRGRLESTDAIFGAWVLDETSLESSNGRIKLNASAESITVFDTAGNPRFIADTAGTLPSPTANAPTPSSGTGTGFSFDIESINENNNIYTSSLELLLNFTSAAGGGSHLITYVYNPANANSSYVYANGEAYAQMGITLVVTDSAGANIQYGTNRFFNAYGDFVDECGGGGYRDGFISVTGDTQITMNDGSTKLANEINKDDKILSFNGINFVEDTITQVRTRPVHYVYLVKVGDIEIKVSDSHTFWANNDTNEISVNDLIQGVSEIYVKVGNTFELRKVNSVSQLGGEQIVYSFSVNNNKNYISNGVVSHNSAPYCYTLTSQYQTVTDPTTFSITTGDLASGASYKVQLLITRTIQSFDTSPFTTYEASSARAKFTEPSGAITLKRISAGTIANGGGFQSVTSETQYLRHDKNSTTGYNTDIKGGLAVDKIYGFSDTLDNAGTPTPFTLIGYDVAGYAMIKGYGRWTMNSSTTGTPATPVVTSVGGCITSLGVISSAAGQGKYTVNYVLTNALGGNSSITPSVFVQGIRDSSSDAECTFDYGKRSGSNASTVIHTQDNNVDTLNNMDELSILVVM